jgi:hypothetical protein
MQPPCAWAETAAPSSADLFHSRCYKFAGPAASLRECVAMCGDGAAPVSPASAAEDAFVWELASDGRFVESIWLGWFRNANGGLSSVTAGAAAEYAFASAPADPWAPCVIRQSGGDWDHFPCDARATPIRHGCVCGSSHNFSLVADVARLEASSAAEIASFYADIRQAAGTMYAIAAAVSVLPAFIFLCWVLFARCRENPRGPVPAIHEASALTTSSHTLHNETMRVLDVARRAFASRRWRFRLATFQLGWTIFVFFAAPPIQWTFTGVNLSLIIGPAYAHIAMMPVGFVLLGLAVLPIDAFVIRIVCWIQFSGYVVWAALMVVGILALDSTIVSSVNFLIFGCAALSLLPTLCCLRCCPDRALPHRAALLHFWRTFRAMLAVWGPTLVSQWIVSPEFVGTAWMVHPAWNLCATFTSVALSALLTPKNRGRYHRFIGSLGNKSSKQSEASTIAALVGGGSAAEALEKGAARFRALQLADVQESDLASNEDTGLYGKTSPAKLGKVTGFISHSWRDAGPAKFVALMAWGSEARRSGVGSPLIWLDKACIKQDQSAEEKQADINALPVFLSGCDSLVALAGPSYASRLWCVVELFVFLHCGGDRERIRVLEFGGVDVRVALNRFDAAEAQCFLKDDQERLLAIIEAGFGSLSPFSALIRSIFIDARATHLEMLLKDSSEGTVTEIRELKATVSALEAHSRALEAKLDRLLNV